MDGCVYCVFRVSFDSCLKQHKKITFYARSFCCRSEFKLFRVRSQSGLSGVVRYIILDNVIYNIIEVL